MSSPSTKLHVAVLGLGAMGIAFSTQAIKTGYTVTTWNRTPGRGKAANLPESPDASTAAANVDIVLIIVADGAAIESICSDSFLSSLSSGTVLCIVSTVAPETVRNIAKRRPGGLVLDCCVMGSPSHISAGKGRFLVGGPKATVDRVAPLLTDLGAGHTYCGEIGAGAVMKITSNLQLVIGVAALAEAVAIARSHGVDDEIIKQINGNSLATSEGSRIRLASVMDPKHPGWFTPKLAAKDVGLALGLAKEMGLTAQVGAATAAMLEKVSGKGWEDFTAVLEAVYQ